MNDISSKTDTPTPEQDDIDLRGQVPESWCCIDCGYNTAPGCFDRVAMENAYRVSKSAIYANGDEVCTQTFDHRSEIYHVRDKVWKKAGMGPQSGCLCIGCLETRIGRRLKPEDFPRSHPFYGVPGTPRLMERRER